MFIKENDKFDVDNNKSQKKLSSCSSRIKTWEGLSFSDYFDDEVPYEVKPPIPLTLPGCMEGESSDKNYGDDYPARAKDLFKGLWEGWSGNDYIDQRAQSFWISPDGTFNATNSHYGWAKSWIKHILKKEVRNTDDAYNTLFKLGFVRASVSPQNEDVCFEYGGNGYLMGKINDRQLSRLQDYAIERQYKLHDDTKDKYLELLQESLLSEDVLNNHRDYWMDTRGRFMRAPNGHFEWALNYIHSHNIPYEENPDEFERSPDDVYVPLFERGFIRIKVGGNRIYANYLPARPPTIYQWRILRDSAIESEMKLINSPCRNRESGLDRDVELESKLIKEEVLKINSEYWLDKNGKFLYAFHGHEEFATRYLTHNKIPFNSIDCYNNSDDNPGCYYAMYSLGFFRIYTDYSSIYANNRKIQIPTNSQMRNLRNAAIEGEKRLYINDRTIDLMESKCVNKDNRYLFIESMMPDRIDEFKTNIGLLFNYLQKKLKLKTIPKVKLVSDEKNAEKILGKTAYYNPEEKEVVLYITDRHQKDVLRSFAHEIIHHWQHENKQFDKESKNGTNDPQYAQNNPHMRKMEKQAYLLGNIMFRDWEDEKKAKDKKSGKKLSEKTYTLGKEYPPKKMDYRG